MIRGRRFLNWLGLVIGGLLFVFQLWLSSKSFFGEFSISAKWVLEVSLALFFYLVQVGIWSHMIMRSMGVILPFRSILGMYLLSGLVRYVPGGFWGYLSRSQWLFVRFAVPYRVTNTGSVIQILGWVVAAGCVVGIYHTLTLDGMHQMIFFVVIILVVAGVGFVLRRITYWKPAESLSVRGMIDLGRPSLPLWRWLALVSAYSILWIGWGSVVVIAAHEVNDTLQWNIFDAAFVYAAAWLIGFAVVFVPAGLGVREFTLSGLLVAQMGMSLEHASAVAVAMRFLTLQAELLALIVGGLLSSQLVARN